MKNNSGIENGRKTRFKNGHVVSEEIRNKISKANKGRTAWNKGKPNPLLAEKNRDIEFRKKISKALKGRKFTKEWIEKLKKSHLGKGHKQSEETKKRLSKAHKGEKCNFWKGGVSKENERIRNGIESRLWREAVFARDNWTCQKCKTKGGKLHPHHIQNFAQFKELRFAIDNGITLCKKCHIEFHRIYGKIGRAHV